jgi:hypothetical protein
MYGPSEVKIDERIWNVQTTNRKPEDATRASNSATGFDMMRSEIDFKLEGTYSREN